MRAQDIHTLLLVIGATALWVALLLAIEFKTLRDDVPGNHITAVLRAAVKKLPWPFILLALVSGFMMGHCFGN